MGCIRINSRILRSTVKYKKVRIYYLQSIAFDRLRQASTWQYLPESQRLLGTEFGFERTRERSGDSGILLRSKGSNSADDKGEDSGSLHGYICILIIECFDGCCRIDEA